MCVCVCVCVCALVEEDTQSWGGGTWHKFIPNPITMSTGMALEGGGARAPGAPLLPPPMVCVSTIKILEFVSSTVVQ